MNCTALGVEQDCQEHISEPNEQALKPQLNKQGSLSRPMPI